jgi:hypothetical protein
LGSGIIAIQFISPFAAISFTRILGIGIFIELLFELGGHI